MELIGEDRWFCPKTDLVLLRKPEVSVWRIFQHKYGSPVNPPLRMGIPEVHWSRFDLDSHATLYGAGILRGAFLESLAYATVDFTKFPLHEIFDDLAIGADPIAAEWATLSHMQPGNIPANWRDARRFVDMRFRNPGYYVDISAAETIGSLRRSATEWAPPAYVNKPTLIDIASLTGSDRALTCAAASWLWKQQARDGVGIYGIRYLSKHGADLDCWARWLPAVQHTRDVTDVNSVATHGDPRIIQRDQPDLQWAARQLGLMVW
ncbi:hypothetical protein [Actinophytocola sp.]|uniref:hypothetical protein n=1 Tax=Actinophytocola sp. TaxID=1872138 RepID=UPI00389AD550